MESNRELTPRHLEILRLIRDGYSNKQIAAKLGIVEQTVKIHTGTIFLKLNVRSRTEAVIACIRRGYITLESETDEE